MLSLWILASVLLGVYLLKWLRSPLTQIPGPPITAISSIWLKLHEFAGCRRTFIHRLHKQYGPIVRLAPDEVSVSSINGMKEIYMSDGSGFDKTELYDVFTPVGCRSMFTTLQKAEHGRVRRLFSNYYSMTNVVRPNYLAAFRRYAQEFVAKCAECQDQSVEVYEIIMVYGLDCTTNFIFGPWGTADSVSDATKREIVKEALNFGSSKMFLLTYYLPWVTSLLPASLTLFPPNLAAETNKFMLSMKDHLNADENTLMRRLYRNTEVNWLYVAAECKDQMLAGIQGVGTVLCYLVFFLSQPQNFAAQQRLHQELTAATPDVALDKLPYLDAVFKEGLRLAPLTSMSLPRYTPGGGCTIDGYFIPGGTIVSCQSWTLHRLHEDVFPQPEKFWPDRWLEEKGAADRARLFFPFSVGGRGCIGKHLVAVEMKVLLREIYSKFQTRIAPDMVGSLEPCEFVLGTQPKDETCKLVFTRI